MDNNKINAVLSTLLKPIKSDCLRLYFTIFTCNFLLACGPTEENTISSGQNSPDPAITTDSVSAFNQELSLELDTSLPIRLKGSAGNEEITSYYISRYPEHGKLIGENPNIHYVPNDPTFTGTDSFTYQVGTGSHWSHEAIVKILVRKNSVTSLNIGGSTENIAIHIPNHLVYRDIGPFQYDLEVRNNNDPLDKTIRRVDLGSKSLTVNMGTDVIHPPYTLSFKWIPNSHNIQAPLFQANGITISQTNDSLITFASGNVARHSSEIKDYACNHTLITVHEDQITTYLNGVAGSGLATTPNSLSGNLTLGSFNGRVWDLRVHNGELSANDKELAAEDCSNTRPTPYPSPIDFTEIDKVLDQYICGVYVCLWYSYEDNLDTEKLHSYLYDQDYFYEHNLFSIGMHAHGDIGGYFEAGRPGWQTEAKSRDLMLNARWIKYLNTDDRINDTYWVHEDFHQYQGLLGQYTGNGHTRFFVEATAEWAADHYNESANLDIIHEYTNDPHLPFWASGNTVDDVDVMINYQTINGMGVNNGGHQYGAFLFISYLEKHVSNAKIVGDIANHEWSQSQPTGSLYELLKKEGSDMKDVFIDFAAATATWDMIDGDHYKERHEHQTEKKGIDKNRRFTAIYDENASKDNWVHLPTGYAPGAWAYNLFKISSISTNKRYEAAFKTLPSTPETAEFRSKVVVYNPAKEDRKYYDLEISESGVGSVTFEAYAGDEIYLVIASTPSTVFTGYEQFPYQYKLRSLSNPVTTVDPEPITGRQIFIMAGQSNMQGHLYSDWNEAFLDHIYTKEGNELRQAIEEGLDYWYNETSDGYASYGYSEEAASTMGAEITTMKSDGIIGTQLANPLENIYCSYNNSNIEPLAQNCGHPYGPELTLGHYISNQWDVSAGLIKVAEGGTTLDTDWLSPSSANSENRETGRLFTQLAGRIQSLKTEPSSIHPDCVSETCNWSAFIWFQGENDSFEEVRGENYESRLTDLISDVRSEVRNPNLPVILVGMGPWAISLDYGHLVFAAQQAVAAKDPNVHLVRTDDLGGFFHYDPPSQLIIGKRIGEKLETALH